MNIFVGVGDAVFQFSQSCAGAQDFFKSVTPLPTCHFFCRKSDIFLDQICNTNLYVIPFAEIVVVPPTSEFVHKTSLAPTHSTK